MRITYRTITVVIPKPLYIAYVDFKAAFDSVDRTALWSALATFGFPAPIPNLVVDLHTNTMSASLLTVVLLTHFHRSQVCGRDVSLPLTSFALLWI